MAAEQVAPVTLAKGSRVKQFAAFEDRLVELPWRLSAWWSEEEWFSMHIALRY